ncbi:hypothetical protein H8356DRAFT_1352951 [Neocallimastix lanati (nom. inval.)]|nr:hypothetical protein H8356DRAFT_1352951 [Neocallimastix sp. JGI-2020a]
MFFTEFFNIFSSKYNSKAKLLIQINNDCLIFRQTLSFITSLTEASNNVILLFQFSLLTTAPFSTKVKYYCGLIKQDFNKENRSLKAQLFYAYKRGNEVMVKYLVEHGFDVNKELERHSEKKRTRKFLTFQQGQYQPMQKHTEAKYKGLYTPEKITYVRSCSLFPQNFCHRLYLISVSSFFYCVFSNLLFNTNIRRVLAPWIESPDQCNNDSNSNNNNNSNSNSNSNSNNNSNSNSNSNNNSNSNSNISNRKSNKIKGKKY